MSIIRFGIFIIVNVLPSSLLNADVMESFKEDRIKVTTLEEEKKRGKGAHNKSKFDCKIVVNDLTKFFKRILEDDFVAIGETCVVIGFTFFFGFLTHYC